MWSKGTFGPGCPTPQPFLFKLGLASGDFVVVDAPRLRATMDDCKDEGWKSYGLFRRQGDCVSFGQTNWRAVD